MKVLILSRKDSFTKTGGDTIQIKNIANRLKDAGIDVDFQYNNKKKYDIVHVFNSYNIDETLENVKLAKRISKKTILTPIYHSDYFMQEMVREKIDRRKYVLSKYMTFQRFMTVNNFLKQLNLRNYYVFRNGLKSYQEKRNMVFNMVDIIMPNSELEKYFINEEVKFTSVPSFNIVFNGVDSKLDIEENNNLLQTDSKYLMCIGRIEPLKNQLAIIDAFKKTNLYKEGYNLIFCGEPNNKKYFKLFLKRVNNERQLQYYGQLEQKKLFSLLKKSAGLVHASWFETTGLIGLEAGLFNVPILMTNKGYTKSYFKNNVVYCDPNSINSIKIGIEKLIDINYDKKNNLNKDIHREYNWNSIVEKIRSQYRELM